MNWQLIDTAPKDGTWILLWRDGMKRAAVAQWFESNDRRPETATYKRWPSEWRGVDTGSEILGKPTHWSPINPPQATVE